MIKVFTDGGSRNNPGPAGIGIVIQDLTGTVLETKNEYIGEKTNNEAEYLALIQGLKLALKYGKEALVFLDSELVVRQLNGQYKVKNAGLKPLFDEVQVLKMGFTNLSFKHIIREKNRLADKLVNEAINRELSKNN
ncbi:MAG: ribonuclease HI family protein [Patescibacteria group bacterium]|nr:ribonuclease HI family protein [Patescibacteria group bacterium]